MTEPTATPFGTAFTELAHADPDRPAVTCADTTLSRAELDRMSNQLAHIYAGHGVGRDDLVSVLVPNSTEFLAATLAIWKLGATPQPLSHRLPDAELRSILAVAEPQLVITNVERPSTSHSDEPLPPASAAAWKAPASGGSTGTPKVIVASQPAVMDSIAAFPPLLGMTPGGVHLCTGPLHHNGPFMMAALALLTGNHVVVMPRFDPAEALRLIEQHRVDWMYAVPTMMHRIIRLPDHERHRHDVSSLRRVMHMAAPCPPWLKRAWIDWLGPQRVWELYAGTEAQAVTLVDGTGWLSHPGSVGPAVIGEISIRDPDGHPLPAGTDGHVWMRRGPGAPAPYRYLGAEACAAPDGWETLGDIGHLDADGYLYLADRDTDMILVGGANVYPAEVEAALDEHPAIRSSCVIGLPHEDLGNVPHAIVQTDEHLDGEVLHDWCAQRLAAYKIPRSFETVSAPLRDDGGKMRRIELRHARLPQ